MRRIYIALITLVAATTVARAQEGTPVALSLQQSMDFAIKNNYTVKNAKLDVLIQDAQNRQTLAAAYPHINGKAELDDYLNPQQTIVDGRFFGQPGTTQKLAFVLPFASTESISGSQVLFDGSVLVALQARKTVMELANLSEHASEVNLRYGVFRAYNSLVVAYKQFGILKSSLAFARSMAREQRILRDSGFVEKIDVSRSDVQINNLESDSMRISNILVLSENALKYQLGMKINTPIVLTDTNLDAHSKDATALLMQEERYEAVPEYNIMTTTLKLNEYNVKRYKLAAIPSLNAFGSMGYNYASTRFKDVVTPNNFLFNSVIGLQLNVPIFNGFLRTNQVREAKLNVEKMQNNIENMKLSIDFQTDQAKSNLKNALLQIQNQGRNLELANEVVDLAQKKYKGGVGSNLEVSTAQTDLLNAQNNYFNTLQNLINAEADLKKALGLLN